MKDIILIPDSFKGTMSSMEICAIMEQAIKKHYPLAQVHSVPVADGGEGSVDSFLQAVGGKKVSVMVKGPYFEDIEAFYGILPDGVAIIEMAAAAGLPLVGENKHAEKTTTFGVGQLMLHAAKNGCKKMIIGLGGSATNDGGCGAAAAAGIAFKNADGDTFIPVGETLSEISKIDATGLNSVLHDIEIVTMCDIDNPLCGPLGAAHVFAPQKGAAPQIVAQLDSGLAHLAAVVQQALGKDITNLHGAGAAGGMGGGMVGFFNSTLQMGIETVLDTVGFDSLLQHADFVFSGEGKIDFQSLLGKVVIGVARRTKKANVPLIAVVGDIDDNIEKAYDEGVTAIFSINRVAVPFEQAKPRSKSDMLLTMDNILRFCKQMNL
ncbi:MAG: glycerate kinase [Oscillospiraceae bacterium]|nr:glycerate kinase [Oscillospiraceae bacterium]